MNHFAQCFAPVRRPARLFLVPGIGFLLAGLLNVGHTAPTKKTERLAQEPPIAEPLVPPATTLVPTPTPAFFPFVIPPFDAAPTATDVSWLNTAPAGANGFLRTEGEHFVDARGRTVRLWGVNISFEGSFPPKEEAPLIAAHLAKFGFNSVRMHQYEGYGAPAGIWKAGRVSQLRIKVPREIDAERFDRFDFFVAELMKRGIYINLNLHVGRKVTSEEGFLDGNLLPEKDKGVNFYDEKLIAAQKEFSRLMLTHVNPYTRRAYKDEPGFCAVEVDNESSLLGKFLEGNLNKIPESYARPLAVRWNNWLAQRYSEESLRDAWTETDEPLGEQNFLEEPLPPGFVNPDSPDARMAQGQQALKKLELKTVSGAAGATELEMLSGPVIDGALRPALTTRLQTAGSVAWSFQINRDGLDVQEGQPYTVTFWARSDTPRTITFGVWQDRQPFRYLGYSGLADLTKEWQRFSFSFRAASPDPGHSRLSWNLANAVGTVQLAQIEMYEGGRIGAPDVWTLENGVPLIEFKAMPTATVRRDFAEFLGSVEAACVAEFRTFLKTELGVRCPVWHSQAMMGGWGGVWREMASDAIDTHAYWKHPDFGGGAFGGATWRVGNASMTSSPGSDPLGAFGMMRVAGKPFVMSEWNSGQPNDFSAEALLMAAAFASWQDWAAVYIFDYHSAGPYNRDTFFQYFSIDTHPAKMATAPAAALIYRRLQSSGAPGDVSAANASATLRLPESAVWSESASAPGQPSAYPVLKTWFTAGTPRTISSYGKTYVQFADVPNATTSLAAVDTAGDLVSDTGELGWARNAPNQFTVDSPRTKVTIGFIAGRPVRAGALGVTLLPNETGFGAFALTSLDGEEVSASRRLLLSAVGRVENKDMVWIAEHTSLSSWGTGPTQAESIAAWVRLQTSVPLRVWALDGTGARVAEVPAEWQDNQLKFFVDPARRTLWYELAVE